MNPVLADIKSIINGYDFAKDKDRVFTYIEFVKMFGYENDTNTFINQYKEYVTRWAALKKESINISDADFVMSKLVDILKSITLDYSSYEEQDFIAHIDLTNKSHLKALTALYSRKIREITEFYRKKRNESVLVVHRNSIKGSTKSIQEVIYEKVFDYLFSDRNIVPSYVNIKRDLLVSVENYVDIYSEYFDIPRIKEFTDKTRAEMLSSNINDVDYRMYLEIELVVSEILFSGNVFLEEIPLIAQLGVDLSQNCVGDMLALKNNLMANTTVNQVPLTEQVALKRRLYEKFLGCDLYYMYVDLQGDIKMDILAKASNPTGNLLNCGTADTATVENEQLELLSHIGLFFKPDKTSILKVNAKDFVWSVDTDVIQPDTMYVFPDPTKYGDIGNNKSAQYPLIMEFKMDYDVKNMSSGEAVDDPLMYINDQGWRSYYSKQDDDFKVVKNTDYEYSFTFLANRGFINDYQTDIWGNQFGIIKGCEVKYKYSNDNNSIIGVESVTMPSKYMRGEITYNGSEVNNTGAVILNGGYFENPFYNGIEVGSRNNGTAKWTFQGSETATKSFDFNRQLVLDDDYNWSGCVIKIDGLYHSDYLNNSINYGRFDDQHNIRYTDHFQSVGSDYKYMEGKDNIITEVLMPFLTQNVFEEPDYEINYYDASYDEFQKMGGDLYVRLCGELNNKPLLFSDAFPKSKFTQITNYTDITDVHVMHNTLIVETKDAIEFVPYSYDGVEIINTLGIREMIALDKKPYLDTKVFYNEVDKAFYILQLDVLTVNDNTEINELFVLDKTIQPNVFRRFLMPRIYKFDPISYSIKEVINFADPFYTADYEAEMLDSIKLWKDYVRIKEEIRHKDNLKKLKLVLMSQQEHEYKNLRDFEITYYNENYNLKSYDFTYNANLGLFLLSVSDWDKNNTPYIHEYRFKCIDMHNFNGSLQTNIYTLKDDGTTYTWNDKIDASQATSLPCNFQSVKDNTIFQYYSNDTGIGVGFSPKKFDFMFGDTDSGNHVDGNKTMWGSNVYIGNIFSLERQRSVEIKGKCYIKGTISKVGENDITVTFTSLQSQGMMNSLYDFLKQNFGFTTLSYRENLTVSTQTFKVKCDVLGNLSGNCKIAIKNTVYNKQKRTIDGYITLSVYGTVQNPVFEVLGAVWDITEQSIDFGNPEQNNPVDPNNPLTPEDENFNLYFAPDEITLGQDGQKNIGVKKYIWTSKIYKGDNLSDDTFEYHPSCYVYGKMYVQGSISRYGDNRLYISFQKPGGTATEYDVRLKDTLNSSYSINCSVNNGVQQAPLVVKADINGNVTTTSAYIGVINDINGSIKSHDSENNMLSFVKVTASGNFKEFVIKIETIVYEMACIYNNWMYYDANGDLDLSKSYLEKIVNGTQLLRNTKVSKRAADGTPVYISVGTSKSPMKFPYMTNFSIGLYSSEVKEVHMVCPQIEIFDRAFWNCDQLTEIAFYEKNNNSGKLNALSKLENAFSAFGALKSLTNPSFVYNLPNLKVAPFMWGIRYSQGIIKTEGDIILNNMHSLLNGMAMFQNREIKYDNIETLVEGIQDLKSNGLKLTDGTKIEGYTGMISISFNTSDAKYTKEKAKKLIDTLVNKGWEVANNIGYNGSGKADTASGVYYCRKFTTNRGFGGANGNYEGGTAYNDNMATTIESVTGVAGKKTETELKQACINFATGRYAGFAKYIGGFYDKNGKWVDEKYPDGFPKIISAWTTVNATSVKDAATKYANIVNVVLN